MNRATITAHQAEALAGYLVSLRPGQRHWTKVACLDALREAVRDHTGDTIHLTRVAVAVALDPVAVTPAVIGMPGAHWEAPASQSPSGKDPDQVRWCWTCSASHRPSEVHHRRVSPPDVDVEAHLEAARRALLDSRRLRQDVDHYRVAVKAGESVVADA